jgi:hypothetical protein
MKLNTITNAAIDAADTQPVRHQLSACTLTSGRVAAAEHFGAGFIVLPRPWSANYAGGPSSGLAAHLGLVQFSTGQHSTAPTSGLCASKQYQQMAPAFATSGGEAGPHPPREPA